MGIFWLSLEIHLFDSPVVILEIHLNLGEILCLYIYTLRPGAADALHSMIQP